MKKIVFTQRVDINESYGERRDCADQRISEFIMACGYIPFPLVNNAGAIDSVIDSISPDGIILTGGNSLEKYGGNAPERDIIDKRLIEISMDKKIPLYGFCRGMQSILDYFGNELEEVSGHVAKRHKVSGIDGTDEVNSYHNQACRELSSDEICATLLSEDGVIEKIRHRSLPLLGTMWHPEREDPFREEDINMLKKLMEER